MSAINTVSAEDIAAVEAHGNFDNYQDAATKSAFYPGQGTALGLAYCALKLNGEAGELAEHVGKAMRDDGLVKILELPGDGEAYEHSYAMDLIPGTGLTDDRRLHLIKEVGDVLWYLSAICNELGVTLHEAANINLRKLYKRSLDGTQRGSGDDR
jgi:NTP pyrophosphatase (non-canonical NTP hydrolase)